MATESRPDQQGPDRIIAVERIHNDVAVTFSDGSTTLFTGPFLYSVREQNGNFRIPDDVEDGKAAPSLQHYFESQS